MTSTQAPRLLPAEEGGPLSRQLVTVRIARMVMFTTRGSAIAYRRISGLSDFETRLLSLVCEVPPVSINELAEMLDRGVAQVSRTVKRLVAAGLLNRARCRGGPGVAISPTPQGRAVYAPLVAEAVETQRQLTAGLSAEDLANLDRYVAVITGNALARLAREQALQGEVDAEAD